MFVFLNGNFVAEENAAVSVFDRGFLYGDGLFETVRTRNGKPFRWARHMERLRLGARLLALNLPFDLAGLRGIAEELLAKNQLPDAVLRLVLTRGVGPRGYSIKGADHPTLVLSAQPLPDALAVAGLKLMVASVRVPTGESMAYFKNCNKLPQILARREAEDADADEALLLNTDNDVTEAATSNVFWIEGATVFTPPLAAGVLGGVTRHVILELCAAGGIPFVECNASLETLAQADGVFLTSSILGVTPAWSLDNQALKQSPLTAELRQKYQAIFESETA